MRWWRKFGLGVMVGLAVAAAGASPGGTPDPNGLSLPAPPAGAAPEACTAIETAEPFDPIALQEVFRDDFAAFDPYGGPWTPHFDHNAYGDWRARTLVGNGEAQLYVDPRYRGAAASPLGLDPFRLAGGTLALVAAPVPETSRPALHGFAYASGMLSSRRSLLQRHGYFEIRARLPSAPGAWAAFWLLSPGRWPPEIDVFEARGGEDAVHVHAHWLEGDAHRSSGCRVPVSRGFHSFGALWRRQSITFYVDRVPVAWMRTPPGLDRPMYMLATLAVGGWGGSPDATRFPAAFEIDRIAVYREAASGGTPLPPGDAR